MAGFFDIISTASMDLNRVQSSLKSILNPALAELTRISTRPNHVTFEVDFDQTVANDTIATFKPEFDGSIKSFSFSSGTYGLVGAEEVTVQLFIGTTTVVGGKLTLNEENTADPGILTFSSPISSSNRFTNSQTISLKCVTNTATVCLGTLIVTIV